MPISPLRLAVCCVVVAAVAACGREQAPPASGSAPAPPAPRTTARDTAPGRPITFHRERSFSFRAAGAPERFIVDARGDAYDSLTVRFEIRTATDSLLFAVKWSASEYFCSEMGCDYDPQQADSGRRVVEHGLAGILDDDAFIPDLSRSRFKDEASSMLFQLASDLRLAREATPGNQVEGELPADSVRAATLLEDLHDMPAFILRQQMAYCILGWSRRTRRVVRVECGP